MAKSKQESAFTGCWQLVSMDAWDVDGQEAGYFEFDPHGDGHFQFASVQGVMDCRSTIRGKEPAVEWTWEGGDEDKPATGRGWAVLRGEELHGMIVIHDADESGFVAKKKAEGPTRLALKKPAGKKAAASDKPRYSGKGRIYTLAVFLPRRPLSNSFSKTKSRVYRTIQIRGDQTLEDLHHAIFHAFDREEEHLYEFQMGKGPKDRRGPIYGLLDTGADNEGWVTETTIDSLRLKVGRSFGYLFDFGDCWQHQINVEAVEDTVPKGSFPRVTKRVGESPPQYPDEDE
jgi:Plasmid pRiA4b ORF-3-like protein